MNQTRGIVSEFAPCGHKSFIATLHDLREKEHGLPPLVGQEIGRIIDEYHHGTDRIKVVFPLSKSLFGAWF